MFIDYYTLKIIWWLFVGVLLIGFALLARERSGIPDKKSQILAITKS